MTIVLPFGTWDVGHLISKPEITQANVDLHQSERILF